jgi:hypothetical protein
MPPPAKSGSDAQKKALIEELPDIGRRATSHELHLHPRGSASKSSEDVNRSEQEQVEISPPWTWSVANSAVKIMLQVPKLVSDAPPLRIGYVISGDNKRFVPISQRRPWTWNRTVYSCPHPRTMR